MFWFLDNNKVAANIIPVSVAAKPKLKENKVREIIDRAKERGTGLQLQDLIEVLLVSGCSFRDIKVLTLDEFRDVTTQIILENS